MSCYIFCFRTDANSFTMQVHYKHLSLSVQSRTNFGICMQQQKLVTNILMGIKLDCAGRCGTGGSSHGVSCSLNMHLIFLIRGNVAQLVEHSNHQPSPDIFGVITSSCSLDYQINVKLLSVWFFVL